MTMALRTNAFRDGPAFSGFRRPAPAKPRGDRAMGIAVVVVAQLALAALLVLGIGVTRPAREAAPITVDLVKEQKQPDIKPAILPRLSTPMLVTAPPPMIDIAPAPGAIQAAPPPLAAMPAPPPVAAPAGDGHAAYIARLLATLERFKQYPAAARSAHIEGSVLVHFTMSRDGRLLSAEIYKSSGRPVLDREALAMMARAGTLPPMPPDMKDDVLDAVIGPINFTLR